MVNCDAPADGMRGWRSVSIRAYTAASYLVSDMAAMKKAKKSSKMGKKSAKKGKSSRK
jgi:hypothetical protein